MNPGSFPYPPGKLRRLGEGRCFPWRVSAWIWVDLGFRNWQSHFTARDTKSRRMDTTTHVRQALRTFVQSQTVVAVSELAYLQDLP